MKNKKTILIVEDDYFFRKIISTKLIKLGFSVLESKNGREAKRYLQKEEVDLLLLDLMMPFFDGFDILEQRKMDRRLHDIPVIVMSLLAQKKDKDMIKKYDIAEYIVKPEVSAKQIPEKVKNYFEK